MSENQRSGDRIELRGWEQRNERNIYLKDGVVHKPAQPWTAAVHSLLRHLESVGFPAAPTVVGDGFDADGLETVTYIEGEFMQPGPWTLEGAEAVGRLLRRIHEATASFKPSSELFWKPWFGRELGGIDRVIGHCDAGPWNIVAREGMPVAFIDWEFAGPVDPMVDLAEACWLNAKLHSDDVAEREGLPPLAERARQLRAIVDGYGLTAQQRKGLVHLMIEFAVHSAAGETYEFGVTPDTTSTEGIWGITWRVRASSWMMHHQSALEKALA